MNLAADINTEELKKVASQVRRDIVRMVHSVQSGHPGGSLGCADYFTALFFKFLKHDPHNFDRTGKNKDVFILSNGHISPVFYSILARSGYFPVDELSTFRKINSRLQGHPATKENLEGVYCATGSLGQGLSVACGMALQKKKDNDPSLVYVNLGDGELQEGQNWEAIMFAAKHKLDNMIITIDNNNAQIDGTTEDIIGFTELGSKFDVFGWEAMEMQGNDMDNILETMPNAIAKTGKGKPIMIDMTTTMGSGVDFMMDGHKWHGIPPSDEQLIAALAQLPETMGDYK